MLKRKVEEERVKDIIIEREETEHRISSEYSGILYVWDGNVLSDQVWRNLRQLSKQVDLLRSPEYYLHVE